ncbi:MAG: hypothetical protein JRN58_07805 [Nitrososphaerota archaeon]|jgi:hypothetical protein|nr:hypothetical protein [Nitrososphaerota archaeon]MDG6978969.1 hypothetical protein [Nitrososphaerota archaeon]
MSALPSAEDEARRLIRAATDRGVVLRLVGGVAVAVRCPSATVGGLRRTYADIDLVGHVKQSRAIADLLTEMGYRPRTRFNAMNGSKRLVFNDLVNRRRVDVFLDVFEMSHRFDFSTRLGMHPLTLPLADLLATKLQVHEITEKDLKDLAALLVDHDLGGGEADTIDAHHLARMSGRDWGAYRTFKANLSTLGEAMAGFGLTPSQLAVAKDRIGRLAGMIEAEPKTLGWRVRARVGSRVPWYEVPEADESVVVDSFD